MTAAVDWGEATVHHTIPNSEEKVLQLVTPVATYVNTDTMTVNLKNYGCTLINGIIGFSETTAGSVVVQEQPTTAVSSGVLTITLGNSTKFRSYIIFAY